MDWVLLTLIEPGLLWVIKVPNIGKLIIEGKMQEKQCWCVRGCNTITTEIGLFVDNRQQKLRTVYTEYNIKCVVLTILYIH